MRGSGAGAIEVVGWAGVKRFGEDVLLCGEGFGAPARERLIRHGPARPLMEAWRLFLPRQSPTVARALRQDGGKAGDSGNLAPARHARRVG